jgi:hypothetical protein
MQSVCSSAAHAGIRGVSPPMPQSPTTKIAHIQSDGRSRARQASRSVKGRLSPGRSKSFAVGPKRLRVGSKISSRVGPRRPRSVQDGF